MTASSTITILSIPVVACIALLLSSSLLISNAIVEGFSGNDHATTGPSLVDLRYTPTARRRWHGRILHNGYNGMMPRQSQMIDHIIRRPLVEPQRSGDTSSRSPPLTVQRRLYLSVTNKSNERSSSNDDDDQKKDLVKVGTKEYLEGFISSPIRDSSSVSATSKSSDRGSGLEQAIKLAAGVSVLLIVAVAGFMASNGLL